MPTTRARHFVIETDDLAEAIATASHRWPGLSRSQLIVRLALEGDRAVRRSHEERRKLRLAAIDRHSGALTGVYDAVPLQALREEWPG